MTSPAPISSTGADTPSNPPSTTEPVEVAEVDPSAQPDPISAAEAPAEAQAEAEAHAEAQAEAEAEAHAESPAEAEIPPDAAVESEAEPESYALLESEVEDASEVSGPILLAGSAARNSDHAISARSTIALILSGLLVALLCVGGAAIGGFFSDVSGPDGQDGEPSATATATTDGATSFADGEFGVGTDIKSGTYTTKVPADSTCSWERASSADGSAASVLDSGVETPGKDVVVTIKATDEVFRSQGCGTWRPVKA